MPKMPKTHRKLDVAATKKGKGEKFENLKRFKVREKKLETIEIRNGLYRMDEIKKVWEILRFETLEVMVKNRLIDHVHDLLKGKDLYTKLVLTHDTSPIIYWMLKYSPYQINQEIARELYSVVIKMMQSKYSNNCAKRLLKYGSPETKNAVINRFYGHVINLSSHTVSAPVFEYAYTTFANNLQKSHLRQEYFRVIYKHWKDDDVKHLRDSYKSYPHLKPSILEATKAKLLRVIDKNLLDSTLVHTVIYQFLSECTTEDKSELISLLIPHIVVLSYSEDGVRVAMQCIWHATNNDRKLAMKLLKKHVVELSRDPQGHYCVISLLDTADDTVLLNETILGELLENVFDLAKSESGRKVLLWLVAPADSTCFYPDFVEEIVEGRESSNSQKSLEVRRREIFEYCLPTLLKLIEDDPKFWLSNGSLAYQMFIILKSECVEKIQGALKSIVDVIVGLEWQVMTDDGAVLGMEDAGIYMILKYLAKLGDGFGKYLIESLTEEVLQMWLPLSRACFLLVEAFENSGDDIQELLKAKLRSKLSLLEKQSTDGAKTLLQKIL